jgi:hypothetical protein
MLYGPSNKLNHAAEKLLDSITNDIHAFMKALNVGPVADLFRERRDLTDEIASLHLDVFGNTLVVDDWIKEPVGREVEMIDDRQQLIRHQRFHV